MFVVSEEVIAWTLADLDVPATWQSEKPLGQPALHPAELPMEDTAQDLPNLGWLGLLLSGCSALTTIAGITAVVSYLSG